MATLSEITGVEEELLKSKFKLEPHFRYDPEERENLLFLSPLLLLEDLELSQLLQLPEGYRQENGAKEILSRVAKDILDSNDHSLFQVPEVIYLHLGYGKNSENKKGMALTEDDAKVWKSFLNMTRFTSATDAVGSISTAHSGPTNADEEPSGEGERPMDIDFPTPEDRQALDVEPDLVSPDKSGWKIPLKGRYALLFSILLIFFDKKKKKKKEEEEEEEDPKDEEGKIGANKISDFLLFYILPYLLSFNHRKVMEIMQHYRATGGEFKEFVEKSPWDIIQESFTHASCEVSDELKIFIEDKYKDYYGSEQLKRARYKLLLTKDDTPIILVPKRYIVKDMPVKIDDIGRNWRTLGDITLVDEFMGMFIKNKEIQEDFLHSLKDHVKNRQGIDYSILLPDEETFNEVIGKLQNQSADYFSRPKVIQKGGRNLISPCFGLVTHTAKHLTVCFSYFQGNGSRNVAALFRAIGAHYLDHFTLALLHGLCLNPRDPNCRVGSLYQVNFAKKMSFKGSHPNTTKRKAEIDFSEAQGKFCRAEFPRMYSTWETANQENEKVQELISRTQDSLKVNPKFERVANFTVVYSTTSNSNKLKSIPFGPALKKNPARLEKYHIRAANLNGCLLSMLAKCGRQSNTGVILAISDTCEKIGSCVPHLSDAIKMIATNFVMAVVKAGLPEVYPREPDPDGRDRDEIECSSSEEDEEISDDEATVTASVGRAVVSSDMRGAGASTSNRQVKEGVPPEEVLEFLSREIADHWKTLGRRLNFSEAQITAFHKDNERFSEKAYQMLLNWKHRDGLDATYQVLYEALCHDLVDQKALAEEFCLDYYY